MSDPKPYLVAGKFKTSDETFEVKSPFDGRTVATVTKPTKDDIEAATAAAHEVSHETRKLPVYARAEALAHISKRLAERGEEVAELIAFLVSPENSLMVGQVIFIDSGSEATTRGELGWASTAELVAVTA